MNFVYGTFLGSVDINTGTRLCRRGIHAQEVYDSIRLQYINRNRKSQSKKINKQQR